MKTSLLIVLLGTTLPLTVNAGAPNQAPRYSAEQAKAEFNKLNGNWQVASAAFQFGGQMIYRFNDGRSTVETRSFKSKTNNSIERETIERYRYRIDLTQQPKRLYLISDVPDSAEQPYIYEFRDGRLWLSPVLAGSNNDAASLRPGPGGSGWLIGLNPIK